MFLPFVAATVISAMLVRAMSVWIVVLKKSVAPF